MDGEEQHQGDESRRDGRLFLRKAADHILVMLPPSYSRTPSRPKIGSDDEPIGKQ